MASETQQRELKQVLYPCFISRIDNKYDNKPRVELYNMKILTGTFDEAPWIPKYIKLINTESCLLIKLKHTNLKLYIFSLYSAQ